MINNSFGIGEFLVIAFNIFLLCIPVLVLWLLFKAKRKISHQIEHLEQEVKELREGIQSLRERPRDDPKEMT
jgi:hypothetical protein